MALKSRTATFNMLCVYCPLQSDTCATSIHIACSVLIAAMLLWGRINRVVYAWWGLLWMGHNIYVGPKPWFSQFSMFWRWVAVLNGTRWVSGDVIWSWARQWFKTPTKNYNDRECTLLIHVQDFNEMENPIQLIRIKED